jgi:hypothetical protein
VGLVQEKRGEAYTGGGKDRCPSTGVERRGLYRRWCEACTGGGKESPLSVLYRKRNWIGGGRTGKYQNSTWLLNRAHPYTVRYGFRTKMC